MDNKKLIGIVLAVLALFLGILPHSEYCLALGKVSIDNCPTPIVSSVLAVVVFAIAVFVSQYDELSYLTAGI